jgi:outer membrane protein TolC
MKGFARIPLLAFLACAQCLWGVAAEQTNVHLIDLPTALRLAGANNLDVQIARERLQEAKANHANVLAQFFPWITPSITYRQHNDKLQDVAGNIIDVDKHSYAPGAAIGAQLEIGDTLYRSLVSKQLAIAAGHSLEAQRQDSVLAAALNYFDLVFAQGAVAVANESLRISSDYEAQLQNAVKAGLAFKGDQLRVRVQLERAQLELRRATEQQSLASARLAQVLRLDPTVQLSADETVMAPLTLVETNATLGSLVQQALVSRPELKQSQSLVRAARDSRKGAAYGPLIPSLGAQAFFGGLGGGRDGVADTFGPQEDYILGLSWRIGPGGLFDFTRVDAAGSRLKIAELTTQKAEDEITRQVVDAFIRYQSLGEQLTAARGSLSAAEEGLRLAQQRKEFVVGIVLENIQSEQDLTRARLDYLRTVMELDKAQYTLEKARGKL